MHKRSIWVNIHVRAELHAIELIYKQGKSTKPYMQRSVFNKKNKMRSNHKLSMTKHWFDLRSRVRNSIGKQYFF